jgi:hypothetical protein
MDSEKIDASEKAPPLIMLTSPNAVSASCSLKISLNASVLTNGTNTCAPNR